MVVPRDFILDVALSQYFSSYFSKNFHFISNKFTLSFIKLFAINFHHGSLEINKHLHKPSSSSSQRHASN